MIIRDILDIITFGGIVAFIIALFWLSSREIRKSLEKARSSEKLLENEREELKNKISEQSLELRRTNMDRINELSKMAEFGRISQGLFHDLMAPLTSIVLHTEKLKNLPKEEIDTAQKTLEKAIEASKKMAGYMQNIRGAMQLEQPKQECNLYQELLDVRELLTFKARTQNVEIIVEKPKDDLGSFTWFGDPVKLRQIFSNLISNAIDSYEDSKEKDDKTIFVFLEIQNQNVIIQIEDNGCGISKENLEKIFNPFFTTKTHDKGIGIGLSIVKSIVENNLKGKISVESTLNKGTTFTLSFSLKTTQE